MRINKYVAQSTGMSRRSADEAIASGRVKMNQLSPYPGADVTTNDEVTLDGRIITPISEIVTIIINKPIDIVVSRNGQGSNTIYYLLPPELQHLKPVGRLDKNSSGLLLLTNDGTLAQTLTHPSNQKEKVYEIELYIPLKPADKLRIEQGINLEDGLSSLKLKGSDKNWTVTMHEGRNRQIRRTFAAAGYTVAKLHRTHFGDYKLGNLESGKYSAVK